LNGSRHVKRLEAVCRACWDRWHGGCRRGNSAFDNDIGRPADHDQVFDPVAADEDQATARVDGRCIQHLKPRLAILAAAHEGGRAGAAAHEPERADEDKKPNADADDCDYQAASIGAHQVI
jgi:hypothetical protein